MVGGTANRDWLQVISCLHVVLLVVHMSWNHNTITYIVLRCLVRSRSHNFHSYSMSTVADFNIDSEKSDQ